MTDKRFPLTDDVLEIDEITYEDNQHEWQVRFACGTEELAKQVKQQMIDDGEKSNDLEYWRKRIRDECNLIEGEEFSRLMGIHEESQLWLKNKEEIKTLKDAIHKTIAELRKHSPHVLDETGECIPCNGMIILAKSIGEFP